MDSGRAFSCLVCVSPLGQLDCDNLPDLLKGVYLCMATTVSVGGRRVWGPMSIPHTLITDEQYDRHTLVDELLHLGLHETGHSIQ